MQATLTDFKYLNPEWKKNTEEERLLGVSMTGICDNEMMSDFKHPENLIPILQYCRDYAVEVNKEWAAMLGIAQAAAVTAVKPSGSVSQFVDSSSGIHRRNSEYYIRTVRNDVKDPISDFFIDQGVPYEVDITNPSNLVFSFPIKAPSGVLYKDDVSAVDQLELWKIYQLGWCEHKPSVTVSVGPDEWMEVGAWIYKNFDMMSGVAFLPRDDHVYQQAPYQTITKEEYEEWLTRMPKNIDWSKLELYEREDATTNMMEFACVAGHCEI